VLGSFAILVAVLTLHALRMLTWALEIAIGAPDEKGTPFGWVEVELNLPAMSHYNLVLPRVHHLGVDGALCSFHHLLFR
jgi:hypothetical protein